MNPIKLAASNSRLATVNVGEKALLFLGLLFLAISLPPRALLPIGLCAGVGSVGTSAGAALCHADRSAHGLPAARPVADSIHPHRRWHHISGVAQRCVCVGSLGDRYGSDDALCAHHPACGNPGGASLPSGHYSPAYFLDLSICWHLDGDGKIDVGGATCAPGLSRLWAGGEFCCESSLIPFLLAFIRARALEEGLELRGDPARLDTLYTPRPVRWHVVAATVALFALIIWSCL